MTRCAGDIRGALLVRECRLTNGTRAKSDARRGTRCESPPEKTHDRRTAVEALNKGP